MLTTARHRVMVIGAAIGVLVLQMPCVHAGMHEVNGGSVLAMAGRECVALAVDKRFGSQNSLIQITPRPVLYFDDSKVMVAFTGVEGDIQSLRGVLATNVMAKYSRGLGFSTPQHAENSISVRSMASLTSHVLYNERHSTYGVEPIVVGLESDGWVEEEDNSDVHNQVDGAAGNDSTGKSRGVVTQRRKRYRPYMSSMDCIGATTETDSFCCAGAASQSMFGTAESLWRPNMEADELVRMCGRAFLSALERDCYSGYGALIYLITPDGIFEYDIAGRSD
jgi:20S proteasome subunit beta 3